MRLSRDRRGQSVVVGTVILFGFLIVALSLYQVQVVPQQSAQTEFEHFEEVQNDLVELRTAISAAGQSERPQFVNVKLGTSYRTRTFTIDPPDPAGTLRTSDSAYNITIRDDSNTTVNVSTRFIEYRPGYNEIESGSMWYDNSVLYLAESDLSRPAVIVEDQNILVDNDTLRLTAVQNDFSASGTRKVAVELYPTSNATNLSSLSGGLDVRIPTRLGSEDGYWNESIENGSVTYQGMDDAAYPSSSEVSALLLRVDSPDNITLNSVGVQKEPTGKTAKDNVRPVDGGSGGGGGGGGSGGDSLPSGEVAYDDANSNGVYDAGETTYTAPDLQSFDRAVNLVVARSTTVSSYDINADAITVDTGVTMENQFGSVSLTTNSGADIRIRGTIDTTNNPGSSIGLDGGTINIRDGSLLSSGSVSLSTSVGDITVDDATIDTTAGSGQSITFDAENGFSGVNAQITSSGSVSLTTSVGDITVDDATIDTTAGSGQSITFDAENGFSGVNAQITSSGSVSLSTSVGDIIVDDATIDTTAGSGQSITFDAQSGVSGLSAQITSSGSVTVTSNSDSITFNNALLDVTDGSNRAITLTTGDELSIESTRLVGDQFSSFNGNRNDNGKSVFVNNAIFERGNGIAKEFDVSPGFRTGNGKNSPQNVNGNPEKGTVV